LANAAKPASCANLLCSFVNLQMIELSSIKSEKFRAAVCLHLWRQTGSCPAINVVLVASTPAADPWSSTAVHTYCEINRKGAGGHNGQRCKQKRKGTYWGN
jgi:hypothetical protein